MSIWKDLFSGSRSTPPQTKSPAPGSSTAAASDQRKSAPSSSGRDPEGRLIIGYREGDPPVEVDPLKISHAFIVLTVTDFQEHYTKAKQYIVESNRACNPELWGRQFRFSMGVIGSSPDKNGFPTLTGLGKGLAECGVTASHSIALYQALGEFAGVPTPPKILVGFAFRDTNPRFLILSYPNSCIPKNA